MPTPLILLILLNFALIGLLPKVFFRRDSVLNVRWWATAIPFWIVPVFLVAAPATGLAGWAPPGWDEPLNLAAVVLSACSVALTSFTVGTHRIPISLWHQNDDSPRYLVTHGAYRWIRHPFYASFLLAFLAAFVTLPHWVTLVALVYAFVALNLTAAGEEQRLSRSDFGPEYRLYIQRTGRFLPRPGGH
jgi:protein-S-isoprenylcysteine O-methyltransferase Ste14